MKIIWTAQAKLWVAEIHRYIARENRQAAKETVRKIRERAQRLRQFPQMGERRDPREVREVRSLLMGHYRIVYEIRQSGDVYIVAVLHTAMNPRTFFEL